jgi:glycosyltransferase involved in cell wall biosynthesis
MSVALVIINRNCGPYIGKALSSVLTQYHRPDEIIVVDGMSDDGSAGWLRKVQGIRLISAEPKGIANARNIGIEAASADWILPLDADDWIEPTFIQECLTESAVAEVRGFGPVGIVATSLRWADSGKVQNPKWPITAEHLAEKNCLFTCSMFRREAWAQVGGYDESPAIYEDWILWARIVKAGWKVAVVPEPLFNYRPRPDGSSAKMAHRHEEYLRNTRAKIAAM